jgi:hypothetical protein
MLTFTGIAHPKGEGRQFQGAGFKSTEMESFARLYPGLPIMVEHGGPVVGHVLRCLVVDDVFYTQAQLFDTPDGRAAAARLHAGELRCLSAGLKYFAKYADNNDAESITGITHLVPTEISLVAEPDKPGCNVISYLHRADNALYMNKDYGLGKAPPTMADQSAAPPTQSLDKVVTELNSDQVRALMATLQDKQAQLDAAKLVAAEAQHEIELQRQAAEAAKAAQEDAKRLELANMIRNDPAVVAEFSEFSDSPEGKGIDVTASISSAVIDFERMGGVLRMAVASAKKAHRMSDINKQMEANNAALQARLLAAEENLKQTSAVATNLDRFKQYSPSTFDFKQPAGTPQNPIQPPQEATLRMAPFVASTPAPMTYPQQLMSAVASAGAPPQQQQLGAHWFEDTAKRYKQSGMSMKIVPVREMPSANGGRIV